MKILEQAEQEFNDELRRQAVDAEKVKLRIKYQNRNLWQKLKHILTTKKLVIRLEYRK